MAHPLGSGFQLTVPAQDEPRFRVVAEGEKGAALFHRGRFTLADGETAFDGWSNGDRCTGLFVAAARGNYEGERVTSR